MKLIVLSGLSLIACFGNAQSLKVEQVKGNLYKIEVGSDVLKARLAWSTKPDSWKKAQPLALKSNHESIELASSHPILRLEESKPRYFYAAPRGINLEGANNFRDLGGYTSNDGRQVKWGKVYRSADISKLTDADLKVLTSLNIKMVCDLRGEKEAESAPDRIPEGTHRIHLPVGSENVGGQNSFMKYMKSPHSADSLLMSFYKRTDHLGKKYKPVFDQLFNLETDQALLFHCSAGKDRTGVGAALILYALGVREEAIYLDYETTNEFRKEFNEQYVKQLVSQGLSESAARNMMAAKPEYLRAAFDAIAQDYGSIDNFLEKEIGLTASIKRVLRNKLLY